MYQVCYKNNNFFEKVIFYRLRLSCISPFWLFAQQHLMVVCKNNIKICKEIN
jgi:hypothetical protein